MPRRRPTESPHSQTGELMARVFIWRGSEPEFAHPFQGQHDIDLMFRIGTERVESLVNPFCRDRRLPEKGPETGGGRKTKLAIAGRGEHDVIRTARSSNPEAADSVRHRTAPAGILLREPVAPGQREFRVRRARAACTTHPTIRPTSTRTAPSRTSVSGSVQSSAVIGALESDGRWDIPDLSYRHAMPVLWPIESCTRARSSGVGCAKIAHMKRTVAASNSVNVSTARMIGPRPRAPQWSYRVTSCVGDEYARRAWCEGLDDRAGRSGRSESSSPPKSHATTAGPIGIKNPDVAPVMPSTR
jgi:hypothetical protein